MSHLGIAPADLRSDRGTVLVESVPSLPVAAQVWAWALLFGVLAALPGLVAVGVGLGLVDVLAVSSVTCACLVAAAAMLGGFSRHASATPLSVADSTAPASAHRKGEGHENYCRS